jgi:hypothetical protein
MTDDELRAEFAGIRTSIDALTQGLTLMVETQETQTEMLARLLEAATQEPEEEGSLARTLERIFATLNTQTERLLSIGGMIDTIGPSVERAVIRGVHRAVGNVDEDGVIQE